MDVELRVETLAAGVSALLPNAWVYRLVGTAVTVFHTNSTGRLLQLKASGNATHPWDYTDKFVIAVGTQLNAYFSRGKSPIPSSVLSQQATAFESITVPPPSAQAARVSPTGQNVLAVSPESRLSLKEHTLSWTSPAELNLLPITFTTLTPAYQTSGLAQGAALWGGSSLTVTENGPAPAPNSAVRQRERAQVLTGSVDAAATRVRVSVLDAQGNAVNLLLDGAATTAVQQVNATLGPVSGSSRPFQVNLLFQNPAPAFGPVQVLAIADGLPRPILEAAFFLMVGVNTTLVDDEEANTTGVQPGPVRGEADDVIVVDFLVSPQASAPVRSGNVAALSAQTRARRMVRYSIRSRLRPLSATQPTLVQTPEMPFFMGELQLSGMTQTATEDLLQRQKHAAPASIVGPAPSAPATGGGSGAAGTAPTPTQLSLSFTWTIVMNWDGPNSASRIRPYSYQESFTQNVALTLTLDSTDRITGASATTGVVAGALAPAPTAIGFPVAGRRLPQVRFNVQRPWGRQAAAPTARAMIAEFQPSIVSGGIEVMRGGDGGLSLSALTINGAALSTGLDPQGQNFVAPVSAALAGPTFRVIGTTPVAADINTLIDEIVLDFFTNNATVQRVQFLPLATWQVTVRRIVLHESGGSLRAFDNRGAGRRALGVAVFGNEGDMPMFGAPAGYGLGQLDNPPVTNNQMWSYLEGLRASVDLIMRVKATQAFPLVQPHIGVVPAPMAQAAYRREIVRAYNGFSELRFNGTTFEIFPTAPTASLPYPNQVLGTNVRYSGTRSVVPFTTADFGP